MEEKIIQEAIDALKNQKRPEIIECPVYGQYSPSVEKFMYSDSAMEYSMRFSTPSDKRVRSVKAFAKIIAEELV